MKTTTQAARENQRTGKSQEEKNKDLVRRAVDEVWNRGEYGNLAEFVAREFVVHATAPGEDILGYDGIKRFYSALRESFPDIHFTIKDQIAEGDKVVTHWTARGTHQGEFNGIAPTGRKVTLTAIDIDRIVNGKAVECWSYMDELGLLRQLGRLDEKGK